MIKWTLLFLLFNNNTKYYLLVPQWIVLCSTHSHLSYVDIKAWLNLHLKSPGESPRETFSLSHSWIKAGSEGNTGNGVMWVCHRPPKQITGQEFLQTDEFSDTGNKLHLNT